MFALVRRSIATKAKFELVFSTFLQVSGKSLERSAPKANSNLLECTSNAVIIIEIDSADQF